ncbi:MAG: hypothetical protein ACRDL8_09060 [Solirubrobacteraceae bacterium]
MSSCSNGGSSLALEACTHVHASIRLYTQAVTSQTSSTRNAKVVAATGELNTALQYAAQANSANPSFNPLMTTLQEAGRTAESDLVPALEAQCAAAAGKTAGSPLGP